VNPAKVELVPEGSKDYPEDPADPKEYQAVPKDCEVRGVLRGNRGVLDMVAFYVLVFGSCCDCFRLLDLVGDLVRSQGTYLLLD